MTALSVAVPVAVLVCGPTFAAGKGRNRTADTTAPSVTISAPTSGSTTSSSVTVTGTASDNVGVDAAMAWTRDHREHSPYPLRHNGTNVHLTSSTDTEATFRSYLFVTQIVEGAVANLSSGLCLGRARVEDGSLKLAELRVILDFTSSETFSAAPRQQPV